MPSGKTHVALTLSAMSGMMVPPIIMASNGNSLYYLLGCLLGTLITPDLDLDNGNITDSLIRKVFPPAQVIWRILWTPYSKLIPHRSPFSHAPVLGTFLRIGYMFLIINLISILYHLIVDTVFSFYFVWNWSLVAGLCHVDTIHFLVDITIKSKEEFR